MRTVTSIAGLCIALCMVSVAQQPAALQISNGPRVENVSGNSAQIAWSTNAAAGTMVLYGTDRNSIRSTVDQGWPSTETQPSGANPGMAEKPWGGTTHRIELTSLQPQTTYYFAVRSTAGENTTAGNATSRISSFTTRGNGQEQGAYRDRQNQNGGYGNQGRSSAAYHQGIEDGRRDRAGNQARNYHGQFDNDNDRAAYQSGYDRAYNNREGSSRDGYDRDGYNNGQQSDRRDRDDDRNGNAGYDRSNGGQYGQSGNNPAFQNGFRDGMNDGRNDYQSRRSSSPTTTSNYRDAMAGYNSSWGSPDQYKDVYRQGYMRGYQRGYNGQGGQDSYGPR